MGPEKWGTRGGYTELSRNSATLDNWLRSRSAKSQIQQSALKETWGQGDLGTRGLLTYYLETFDRQ
ncbi:MAG: hypothetical protein F6J93_16255 [Oscillatoria sp. SIO1A7]|nr:hypothetical protein [Oscillatoria sp. SIO1A7]